MRSFDTTQECNAYNQGFLAAMRARPGLALKVIYLDSQAERDAWQDGVMAAQALLASCEGQAGAVRKAPFGQAALRH